MKTKLLTALLAMLLSSHVFAVPKMTIGNVDCGQWIARKGNSNGNNIANALTETRVTAWTLGFVTGLNFDGGPTDFLQNISAEQIFLWMDNYCKANPLHTVTEGGQALIRELSKK